MIACSFDDFNPCRNVKAARDVAGLPESELRAAGTDGEQSQWSPKRNMRRTALTNSPWCAWRRISEIGP